MKALVFTGGQIEGDGGAAALLGLKPSTLRSRMKKQGITTAGALLVGLPRALPIDWSITAMQRRHISAVLSLTDGRIEGAGGAADVLGLKPSTLRTRMAMLRIKR